jgi:hypothetical protein
LRAELAAAGPIDRLNEGRRQWSAILMRQALYDLADRKLLAAGVRVAAAAMMRPEAAVRRLIGRRPAPVTGRDR